MKNSTPTKQAPACALALACILMSYASAADVVYRTNRVFQATDSTIGEARVFNIANGATNLTGIILAGSPITTNSQSATEREGVSWGQPSATQAWYNITNGGPLTIGTYTNIFDDPGWIKGVKSVTMGGNTSHGAYMWYLQNNLSFTTPGSTFYTNAGKTYLLDKVLVGTLGDYLPGTNYTETFPKMNDPAASNYPDCRFLTSELPADSETVKYSFDTAAYYQLRIIEVNIVLTNVYPGIPIRPIYDDTAGKKWVIATLPEPQQINVLWDVQLIGLDCAAANIKYQRGTMEEGDVEWEGTAVGLYFTNGWLNGRIRLNDGSNAVPQMSLSSHVLTISSVQQGDRIIVEEPDTGCRDEIAVVKNFSWNDLQRLGAANLEMHSDFGGLNPDIAVAIVENVIFCLDASGARDQKTQLTNESFPDSGLSSEFYTDFQATHTSLLQLDIPSARSVGKYPGDYYHWHMGLEVATLPTNIVSKMNTLEAAVGLPARTFGGFQENTAAELPDLLNATYSEMETSFMLSHTYEGGEADDADYLDPDGGSSTLKAGDPIRNIRWEFGSSVTPELSYPGSEDDANEWRKGADEPPQEVVQVGIFVNRDGKVVIVGGEFNGAGSSWNTVWGMQSDALRE